MKKFRWLGAMVLISALTVSAESKFPLRVDIDVSTKKGKQSVGAGADGEVRVETIQVKVKVRKSGGSPYTDPVTAELYVIGKQIQTGYFGIIDVVKGEYTFDKDSDYAFEFASQMHALPQTSGNINVGATYETYLVVIADQEGSIIETRSGRRIRDEGIAFIRELGPRTLFDRDGNVLGKAEFNKEGFSRAAAAATDPGDDD